MSLKFGSLPIVMMISVAGWHMASANAELLTVAGAIETTRFMKGGAENITVTADGQVRVFEPSGIFISPDKKIWAALLVKGDIERNGNWGEILVGSLVSLEAAEHPTIVARLFTNSFGNERGAGAVQLTKGALNTSPLQWLEDGRRIALLWDDGSGSNQIFTVDVRTGETLQQSKHSTSINGFRHHGATFLYTAEYNLEEANGAGKRDPARVGVTIETRNGRAALRGIFDGTVPGRYYKWRILDESTGQSRDIAGLSLGRFDWTGAFLSRDGKFALVESAPESVPAEWDLYTEPFWSDVIRSARRSRDIGMGRQLKQLYVVDMRFATARPLWNAPALHGSKISWSPDGRTVAISPSFVPVSHVDADGLSGAATAVVDIESGRFWTAPVPGSLAARAAPSLEWIDRQTLEIQDGEQRHRYRERGGEWRQVSLRGRYLRATELSLPPVDVRIDEELNNPPVLIATERDTGRRRVIFDPNPQLKNRFALGRVEMIQWRDSEARVWNGRLYYPVGWRADRRYPLVIQTAGYARSARDHKFSLYGYEDGPGLGPGVSTFAAQPLANRGMMVLSTERKDLPDITATPKDASMHAAAYEAAIDHLYDRGLVDRKRVGISGFSNTGYLVQYTLVHSAFHYAAAITDDNFDGGYLQYLMNESKPYAEVNGAEPFAAGLQTWIQRAPAFNADKIRTPLRLQITSPGLGNVLSAWEMFTRLRELGKPVEYFLIPEHGAHGIQNPAQCLASQEAAVDWFDFWLNDHEDSGPAKADQYARWRKLRALSADHPEGVSAAQPRD